MFPRLHKHELSIGMLDLHDASHPRLSTHYPLIFSVLAPSHDRQCARREGARNLKLKDLQSLLLEIDCGDSNIHIAVDLAASKNVRGGLSQGDPACTTVW